jgi:hypothetical protein
MQISVFRALIRVPLFQLFASIACFFILQKITNAALVALGNFPKLSELNLSRCAKITDYGCTQLVAQKHCRHQLRKLLLASCKHITDVSVKAVASHCRQLQEIDADGCDRITDASLKALGEFSSDGLHEIDLINAPNFSLDGIRGMVLALRSKGTQVSNGTVRLLRGFAPPLDLRHMLSDSVQTHPTATRACIG